MRPSACRNLRKRAGAFVLKMLHSLFCVTLRHTAARLSARTGKKPGGTSIFPKFPMPGQTTTRFDAAMQKNSIMSPRTDHRKEGDTGVQDKDEKTAQGGAMTRQQAEQEMEQLRKVFPSVRMLTAEQVQAGEAVGDAARAGAGRKDHPQPDGVPRAGAVRGDGPVCAGGRHALRAGAGAQAGPDHAAGPRRKRTVV